MKHNTAPFSLSSLSSSFPSSVSLSSPPYSSSSSLSSSSLSSWRRIMLAIVIVVLYTSTLSQACFIRNCPKGGKRSMESVSVAQRPCMSCGPGNTGQCVGPKICCSVQTGCHFGTAEAEVCQKENESVTPCYIIGDACGAHDSGRCVAEGICCDSESCAINERCSTVAQDKGKILNLIRRLLQNKSYN